MFCFGQNHLTASVSCRFQMNIIHFLAKIRYPLAKQDAFESIIFRRFRLVGYVIVLWSEGILFLHERSATSMILWMDKFLYRALPRIFIFLELQRFNYYNCLQAGSCISTLQDWQFSCIASICSVGWVGRYVYSITYIRVYSLSQLHCV